MDLKKVFGLAYFSAIVIVGIYAYNQPLIRKRKGCKLTSLSSAETNIILSHLSFFDCLNLVQTCRKYVLIKRNNKLWEKDLMRYYVMSDILRENLKLSKTYYWNILSNIMNDITESLKMNSWGFSLASCSGNFKVAASYNVPIFKNGNLYVNLYGCFIKPINFSTYIRNITSNSNNFVLLEDYKGELVELLFHPAIGMSTPTYKTRFILENSNIQTFCTESGLGINLEIIYKRKKEFQVLIKINLQNFIDKIVFEKKLI